MTEEVLTPERLKAEARQKAHEWFNEHIIEIVAFLKEPVKFVKKEQAKKAEKS